MDATAGDLALLDHPIARQLLRSPIPVRLAYVARDGAPRVVPMQFHWTGDAVVLSCWPDDPKVAALQAHPRVALSIDTAEAPYKVLQIRGEAAVTLVDGVPPELEAAATRYMGPEAGRAWAAQAARMSPQMVQIAVRPGPWTVERAYADKYDTRASLQYVRGFRTKRRRESTMEFRPR